MQTRDFLLDRGGGGGVRCYSDLGDRSSASLLFGHGARNLSTTKLTMQDLCPQYSPHPFCCMCHVHVLLLTIADMLTTAENFRKTEMSLNIYT